MSANPILEVRRDDLADARINEAETPELGEGEVLFRVERFALTANNITYGVMGDALGYWDFFPAEDEGWGRIPAMGWAELIASQNQEIEPGGRYYGWYPMAGHCTMTAGATAGGLRDVGPHRAEHAPIYRAYGETSRDPLYREGEDNEDRQALLRGLFGTAWLADDFFAENSYFGADRAVVLSASSKTAIGFAQRAAERGLGDVVGLTSPANIEFVESLGFYDTVLAYDALNEIAGGEEAVAIDMAGNGPVLDRLHNHLGDRLQYSMVIGMSHHDAPREGVSAGPDPVVFFAPTQMQKRSEELGAAAYGRLLGEALDAFIDGSRTWLQLERTSGPEKALDAYRELYAGSTPPSTGRIVSLHG